jgi:thiamine transport system substrate-binding protein
MDKYSHFLISLFLLIAVALLAGCGNRERSETNSKPQSKVLNILTLERTKASGYLQEIVNGFEQNYQCKVDITTCAGSLDLMEKIRNEKEIRKYDLVFGIDNCFFAADDEYARFAVSDALKNKSINQMVLFDKSQRLIPYGYGYLAVVYDETTVTAPPESFGELQDSRFRNQLVVSDPNFSGIGRAVLLWSLALFGNDGYQQFWKSIKKNIYASKETWQEVISTLQSRQCGMAFGFTSTPAWLLETQTDPLPLKATLMKEGSFLYIEAAAIPAKANHKSLANDFLKYVLLAENQKYVAYRLGIFPVNELTPLPDSFSAAPYATYSVNVKLKAENPAVNLSDWLDFWNGLFSNSLY